MAFLGSDSEVKVDAGVAPQGQDVSKPATWAHVTKGDNIDDVLDLDASGVNLDFAFEKGKFFEMSEDDIRKLGKENAIRYNLAMHLNASHDPEMDGFSSHFSVSELRDQRAKLMAQHRDIPGTSDALRQMTAYAGRGYKGRFCRPDKIGYWQRKGFEVVQADPKTGNPVDSSAFVDAPVQGSYFATRTSSAKDELIYMRETVENNKKRKAELAEAAKRLAAKSRTAGQESGIVDLKDTEGRAFKDIGS